MSYQKRKGHEKQERFCHITDFNIYYNMTVMVLVGNEINFAIAAGLIRLHMPRGK